MRRAALIYNPMSGQRHGSRPRQIAEIVAVLEGGGVEVEVLPTAAPQGAGKLARGAVAAGCDTVLACGGDGTAHEALQGMVGVQVGGQGVEPALGVIPMGTANALAMDLGLPASPVRAARALLTAVPTRISLGRVSFLHRDGEPSERHFIVAAGIGADALFFSRLDSRLKHRFGYAAYLVEALRMWATHRFPLFPATFIPADGGAPRTEQVSQILAVRIGNFGGAVNRLVPGASLDSETLHVIAFKTQARWRYLRLILAVIFRCHRLSSDANSAIELMHCSAIECGDPAGAVVRSLVEADGEWLGGLPVRIDVVPRSLTLLMPQKP